MEPKFKDNRVACFLLLHTPFCPNGSTFDPSDQNGLRFGMRPGKAPRAEGGREEEDSPHKDGLARPNQRSADFP